MVSKEECESIGYKWIEKDGHCYCVNPRDESSKYISGQLSDTPELAYESLKSAIRNEWNESTSQDKEDIFYPTNFHADWETTGKAPIYTYSEGMQLARDGKDPGFGTGSLTYYMEGWIEKRGDKYIAYGEAQPYPP